MIALSTVFKYLSLIGSFSVVGTLLTMGFLLLDSHGKLSTSAQKLRTMLWISGLTWFIGSIGTILFTLATILDQPISFALDAIVLRSFVTQITLGQYLLFQSLVALFITKRSPANTSCDSVAPWASSNGISKESRGLQIAKSEVKNSSTRVCSAIITPYLLRSVIFGI